jgi:hypothetical protein
MLPQSCVLPQARSPCVADPRQADTRPSSGLRQVSPDSRFLFAFPGRRSWLAHGSVLEPAWQLLPGRCNRSQHQRMSHLDLGGVRKQMIVDPAAEDRRLHGNTPWLRECLHPTVQLASGRSNLAFLLYPATRVLHAVADRLLVYVQSDVIHMSFEEPPWSFSESASPLSSAYATPRAPL